MLQKIKASSLTVFVLIMSGCAALPFGSPPRPTTTVSPKTGRPVIPYNDYAGVVHVHTSYSHHSTGSFEEVAEAARKTETDFVIITDHDNLRGLSEKKERMYGDVLMLVGTEVSTPAGHLAVLGVQNEINQAQETGEILKEVRKAGASGFICHADWATNPWTDWTLVPYVRGMEIYNLPAAMVENGIFMVGLKALILSPYHFMRSFLKRPDVALARWDEILAKRRFVGIGSVDAHQRYRVFGKPIDGYEAMFKVVQTHALARDLSKQAIFDAFHQGHVYVAFDLVEPVRDFLFMAETRKKTVIMGDEINDSEDLQIRVFLPAEADIRILKDGKFWKTVRGDSWSGKGAGPGVYRVEVYFDDKPWIFSNPIYVRKVFKWTPSDP